MLMKRNELTNAWFFKDMHPLWKVVQIFVKGDAIVIAPFLAILAIFGLFDWYAAALVFGVFYTMRFIGEISYWLLHQFHVTGYRPYDFGFTKLSNKAIYIIYQLLAIVNASIWMSFVLYLLFVL